MRYLSMALFVLAMLLLHLFFRRIRFKPSAHDFMRLPIFRILLVGSIAVISVRLWTNEWTAWMLILYIVPLFVLWLGRRLSYRHATGQRQALICSRPCAAIERILRDCNDSDTVSLALAYVRKNVPPTRQQAMLLKALRRNRSRVFQDECLNMMDASLPKVAEALLELSRDEEANKLVRWKAGFQLCRAGDLRGRKILTELWYECASRYSKGDGRSLNILMNQPDLECVKALENVLVVYLLRFAEAKPPNYVALIEYVEPREMIPRVTKALENMGEPGRKALASANERDRVRREKEEKEARERKMKEEMKRQIIERQCREACEREARLAKLRPLPTSYCSHCGEETVIQGIDNPNWDSGNTTINVCSSCKRRY